METKRLTLFAGHYGSGKTNIAVNYAVHLKQQGKRVLIADLDIVNPYFRTKDSEAELQEQGIELICSAYANTNIDAPALPAAAYRIASDKAYHGVVDIGGDDRGALVMGRYTPDILAENNYEMIFVFNRYRPLTGTAEAAMEIMREVETASGIPFTAIANNSNLGPETTAQTVLDSATEVERLSRLSGLPVIMTTAMEQICAELEGKMPGVFPLKLQKKNFLEF